MLRGFPFTRSQRDEAALARLRTPRTEAHYLLQLGYFRAHQWFFSPDLYRMQDDLAYVCDRFLENVMVPDLSISLHTRFQHYQWIVESFGYRMLESSDRERLEALLWRLTWPEQTLRSGESSPGTTG